MPQFVPESLTIYPELQQFLSAFPPDVSLLKEELAFNYNLHVEGMYSSREYTILQICIIAGKKDHFTSLLSHYTSEVNEAMTQELIKFAAAYGQTDIIMILESGLSTEKIKEIFSDAMILAVQGGYVDTFRYLQTHFNAEELVEIVKDHDLFNLAAQRSQSKMLVHLGSPHFAVNPAFRIVMNNYTLYHKSLKQGDLQTIIALESFLTPLQRVEAIKARSYYAIGVVHMYGHTSIMEHFLQTPIALAFIEAHSPEYGQKYVHPFIDQKITSLQDRKRAYEQIHAVGVFDIASEEANIYFYMIRNLIRRGVEQVDAPAENVLIPLNFLLNIPAIRALCHQNMQDTTENVSNELLRFAMRIGNEPVVRMLLQIPEVRRLAIENHFYANEEHTDLDVAALVENDESSMTALSVAEQSAVARIQSYYKETIANLGGESKVFDLFLRELQQRYQAHPAVLYLNEEERIELPIDWNSFQVLIEQRQLNKDQVVNALNAYYTHSVHTAFRYLSKPNYWLDPEALYIHPYLDEQGRHTGAYYADFEAYKPLIALFYLAAVDKDMPATDGYTIEGRIELFIKNIALIGRAHNWDDSRPVFKNGAFQYDDNGNMIFEAYDDGKRDKSSCYSGVHRRLFMSVLGHKLLAMITVTIIIQAMEEQVRLYFSQKITRSNVLALKNAYDGLVNLEGNAAQHQQQLDSVNISDEEKQGMIERVSRQLEESYEDVFREQAAHFQQIMQNHLSKNKFSSDFVRFYASVGLGNIISAKLKEPEPKASREGFFSRNEKTECTQAVKRARTQSPRRTT